MDFNFKKYVQSGKKIERRMTVTKTGHIGLPTQFYKDNKIDNYKFAVIYYDKDNNSVGVRFTNNQEVGALQISKNRDGYGGYISAKNFFAFNKIAVGRYAQRYEYKKLPLHELGLDGSGHLFILQLEERPKKPAAKRPVSVTEDVPF